jgi:hypothetical protein
MTISKKAAWLVSALAALLSARGAAADGRIQTRRENQQKRIASGISSGQLTPRETGRLERREARLDSEIRDMREGHGGSLTPRDRRIVDRQQNRLSRQIYRHKHDGERR